MEPKLLSLRGEGYYRSLLQIAQAAHSHLDLGVMLESLTAALSEVVPLGGIGIGVVEPDGTIRPYSAHVAGLPREPGETVAQTIERAHRLLGDGEAPVPTMTRPLAGSIAEHVRDKRAPLLCPDLDMAEGFVDVAEFRRLGVRSMLCVPLFVRDWFLGAIYYMRSADPPLDAEAARFLEETTPCVAMAVGNAVAFEEILRLRDRLAQEVVVLRDAIDTQGMFEEIVGSSPAMREVLASVQMVAPADSTVLIMGETGTGKELIARAIHKRSRRAEGPLITVNCAALPSTLIASELFGHERGAFTGALQRRIGRFELADDGTIFLDEIGDIPPDVQVALLRVLQEHEFERVGGSQVIRTNARIIAATHRDLHAAVEAGTFRSDLYFRLNVFPIVIPPLRQRTEDVPPLVEYFAQRHSLKAGRAVRSVDAASLRKLVAYPWPGNVRELENVIERAVILCAGDRLQIDDQALRGARAATVASVQLAGASLRAGLRDAEKRLIEEALAATGGKISGMAGAAHRLDLPASTLERKIRVHGIDKYRFRRVVP